jgi:hypothetical protein
VDKQTSVFSGSPSESEMTKSHSLYLRFETGASATLSSSSSAIRMTSSFDGPGAFFSSSSSVIESLITMISSTWGRQLARKLLWLG